MGLSDSSRRQSLLRILQKYLSHYRESNVTYISITLSSVLFGLNGFTLFPRQEYVLGVGVFLCISFSLAYTYRTEQPFGIDISCTPTHLVDGRRQTDKMSEQRDIAMIQNGEVVIHGNVKISRFTDKFKMNINTSSEIDAELRTKPKTEHDYDPVQNTLSCEDISEYEFPLVIEVARTNP